MKNLINEQLLNHHIETVVSKHLKESYEDPSQKAMALKLLDNVEKNVKMIRKLLRHQDADIVLGEHEEMFYKFQELFTQANELRELVSSELDPSNIKHGYDQEDFAGQVKYKKVGPTLNERKK